MLQHTTILETTLCFKPLFGKEPHISVMARCPHTSGHTVYTNVTIVKSPNLKDLQQNSNMD